MSSTASRRMRRKMDKDIKKNIKGDERDLQIPTEEEIQIYINNKIEELKSNLNVQLQEGETTIGI
jgi:hypothetical protein